MKKVILCLMVLGLSIGAFAQNNEVGILGGGLNGLSYKKMMSENFAIQTDLAVGFQRTSIDWLGDSELITATADLFGSYNFIAIFGSSGSYGSNRETVGGIHFYEY